MNAKKWIVAGICIICMFCIGKAGAVRATEAVPEVYEDILKNENYIEVSLGKCYLGKKIFYDIPNKKTLIEPFEEQKQIILREDENVEVYYGKYRGSEKYDNFRLVSSMLDIEFFFEPFLALQLTKERIEEENYFVHIEEEQEVEYFSELLIFAEVLNGDEADMDSVDILFDEKYRPVQIQFHFQSTILSMEQLEYLEQEMTQQYRYVSETEIEVKMRETEEKMSYLVPEKEITIEDYVTELPNILRARSRYLIQSLLYQGEELTKEYGWDKSAVLAYMEAVNTKFNLFGANGYEAQNVMEDEYLQEIERIYESARQIGSDVYTYMFEESKISPKKKALLVIEQMGGYMDNNGMLQFGEGDRFAPEMAPHSAFLEDYAECVRKACKKKNLDSEVIHQFRMYIDKQNIEYVRGYYEGKTDYERLKAYAKNFNMKLYYGEPSRHHNKTEKEEKFKEQRYDKILTPNKLSEFIIDTETGSFVTEWDVLKKTKSNQVQSKPATYKNIEKSEKKKVVNSESFNYAPADYNDAHYRLDVLPATPADSRKKTYLDNNFKRSLKKIWKSPERVQYKEKYKSPKDYLK
ncbi:hypothetical protein JCM31739_05360 [Faecalimonas canis]